MKNFKMMVPDCLNIPLQNYLFSAGCAWDGILQGELKTDPYSFLYVYEKGMKASNNFDLFDACELPEITFTELKDIIDEERKCYVFCKKDKIYLKKVFEDINDACDGCYFLDLNDESCRLENENEPDYEKLVSICMNEHIIYKCEISKIIY